MLGRVTKATAAFSIGMLVACGPSQEPESTAHPDFTGVWFPAGFARQTPDPLPFNDDAKRLLEEYQQHFVTDDDPGRYCIWPGMPRVIWGPPFSIEIFHREQDVTMYWEGYGMYRKIYMADHNPPEPILPTAMGHSLAHWEGDTLVVETTNLKPYPYMDRLPSTSDARITERLRLEERDENGERSKYLVADVVMTDPKLYTEPVHVNGEIQYRPDIQVLEYTCSGTLWEEYLGERGLTLPDLDALPNPAD